jgi:hypothetical protein
MHDNHPHLRRVTLAQVSIILVTLACTVSLPLPDIFLNTGTGTPAAEQPATPPGEGFPPESFPVRYYHKEEDFSFEAPSGWLIEEANNPESLTQATDPVSGSVITLAKSVTLGDPTSHDAERSFLATWLHGSSFDIRGEQEFTTSDGVMGWAEWGTKADLETAMPSKDGILLPWVRGSVSFIFQCS